MTRRPMMFAWVFFGLWVVTAVVAGVLYGEARALRALGPGDVQQAQRTQRLVIRLAAAAGPESRKEVERQLDAQPALQALAAAARGLESPDERVRRRALHYLEHRTRGEELAMLQDASHSVHEAAIEVLQGRTGAGIASALMRVAKEDKNDACRLAAARGLARYGANALVGTALLGVSQESLRLMAAAADSAERLKESRALAPLLEQLERLGRPTPRERTQEQPSPPTTRL